MKVVVHIDRVVLDGFAPGTDPTRLRAALEAELSRSLAEPYAHRTREAGGPALLAPADLGHGPETLGRGIARAAITRMDAVRDAIGGARS